MPSGDHRLGPDSVTRPPDRVSLPGREISRFCPADLQGAITLFLNRPEVQKYQRKRCASRQVGNCKKCVIMCQSSCKQPHEVGLEGIICRSDNRKWISTKCSNWKNRPEIENTQNHYLKKCLCVRLCDRTRTKFHLFVAAKEAENSGLLSGFRRVSTTIICAPLHCGCECLFQNPSSHRNDIVKSRLSYYQIVPSLFLGFRHFIRLLKNN
ncbi:unnamed protein product [Nesidiocoris tenuis]|uniref:Uncharacterized protein n=1 Tax=Nesidiocoris tenuis TaxID=355587 RepID=A0A6H5GI82_9HEMI|nr:unnamed protein product [Nesidiocoris tenuis]